MLGLLAFSRTLQSVSLCQLAGTLALSGVGGVPLAEQAVPASFTTARQRAPGGRDVPRHEPGKVRLHQGR